MRTHTNTTKNEINQSQNSSANNSIRFARFGSSIASICINYKYAFFVLSCVLCLCCALHERNVQIAVLLKARQKSSRCITICAEFFCFLFTHICARSVLRTVRRRPSLHRFGFVGDCKNLTHSIGAIMVINAEYQWLL